MDTYRSESGEESWGMGGYSARTLGSASSISSRRSVVSAQSSLCSAARRLRRGFGIEIFQQTVEVRPWKPHRIPAPLPLPEVPVARPEVKPPLLDPQWMWMQRMVDSKASGVPRELVTRLLDVQEKWKEDRKALVDLQTDLLYVLDQLEEQRRQAARHQTAVMAEQRRVARYEWQTEALAQVAMNAVGSAIGTGHRVVVHILTQEQARRQRNQQHFLSRRLERMESALMAREDRFNPTVAQGEAPNQTATALVGAAITAMQADGNTVTASSLLTVVVSALQLVRGPQSPTAAKDVRETVAEHVLQIRGEVAPALGKFAELFSYNQPFVNTVGGLQRSLTAALDAILTAMVHCQCRSAEQTMEMAKSLRLTSTKGDEQARRRRRSSVWESFEESRTVTTKSGSMRRITEARQKGVSALEQTTSLNKTLQVLYLELQENALQLHQRLSAVMQTVSPALASPSSAAEDGPPPLRATPRSRNAALLAALANDAASMGKLAGALDRIAQANNISVVSQMLGLNQGLLQLDHSGHESPRATADPWDRRPPPISPGTEPTIPGSPTFRRGRSGIVRFGDDTPLSPSRSLANLDGPSLGRHASVTSERRSFAFTSAQTMSRDSFSTPRSPVLVVQSPTQRRESRRGGRRRAPPPIATEFGSPSNSPAMAQHLQHSTTSATSLAARLRSSDHYGDSLDAGSSRGSPSSQKGRQRRQPRPFRVEQRPLEIWSQTLEGMKSRLLCPECYASLCQDCRAAQFRHYAACNPANARQLCGAAQAAPKAPQWQLIQEGASCELVQQQARQALAEAVAVRLLAAQHGRDPAADDDGDSSSSHAKGEAHPTASPPPAAPQPSDTPPPVAVSAPPPRGPPGREFVPIVAPCPVVAAPDHAAAQRPRLEPGRARSHHPQPAGRGVAGTASRAAAARKADAAERRSQRVQRFRQLLAECGRPPADPRPSRSAAEGAP
eukprot:EG_transcript_1913